LRSDWRVYASICVYSGTITIGMNKLVLVGISIVVTGCAVPPIDRVNSCQGRLGSGILPMCGTDSLVWDVTIPQDQSFWNRWHYTYNCLTRYSQGKGWGDRVTNL
jgi:hypothetical protein